MISMNPFFVYAPGGGMVGYRQTTTGEHTVSQQVNSTDSLRLPLFFRYSLSIHNAQFILIPTTM